MTLSIDQRIRYTAYLSYFFAALSVVATFTMPSDLTQVTFAIVLAALWYQVATSLVKRKKWAWWASVTLLGLLGLANFSSVFRTIIAPMFDEAVTGVGYGRWVALAMVVLSGMCIYWLTSNGVRSEFSEKPNK